MIKQLAYLVLIITLCTNCKTDDSLPDCSTISCAAPFFLLDLVDSTTNENIILQDNITEAAIMLKDASGNPFQFTIINSSGLLYIEKKGPSDFLEIRIDSELVTSLSYNTSKPNTNECCDFGNLIDVEVTDKTFSVEDNTVTISL
ncbi:hypothetical protein [uncultured Algibacter sp.]|uniref:hypothetical protein n=1 Tax=uncultured Algibacter sp. TaxID=298659 RepID=UPI00260DD236|nr:hypothetical protein [uncultured Algibacter sp.]